MNAQPRKNEVSSTPNQDAVMSSALRRARVVPVVTVFELDDAPDLVGSLIRAGLPIVEITLRTAAGVAALRACAGLGGTIGAGTVTTAAEAGEVIDAGAQFVVSPGLDEGVVRTCLEADVPVIPGIATPTELMAARALGLRTVKVFPAGHLGGPGFVRGLAAVWSDMEFMPTGGISAATAPEYLAIPAVAAVGGSWMVPSEVVRARAWTTVDRHARAAAEASVTDA